MKITANFWIKGLRSADDEMEIFSMYELSSIPFKVGDEIECTVEWLVPKDLNEYKPNVRITFEEENNELTKYFDRRKIQIVSAKNYMRFSTLTEGKLTVEYFCKILNPFE